MKSIERFKIVVLLSVLFMLTHNFIHNEHSAFAASGSVSIITDKRTSPVVRHGLSKVIAAFQEKEISFEEILNFEEAVGDFLIVAGLTGGAGEAEKLIKSLRIPPPEHPESLLIHRVQWDDKNVLLISGFDERGLMYALLDVAERIGWAKDRDTPLSEVQDFEEKPEVVERAVSKMVVNQSEFERFCFSEEFWDQYLDMLAKNRFNTFVLMFGYASSGYFAPIYPYLFDVEGFPEIRVVGITEEEKLRNLEMLRMIIRKTHERGMQFTLALWTHISAGSTAYRTVQNKTPGLVWGLTDDNLIEYTKKSFTKFLTLVNEMDAIQFRVHVESAVRLPDQISFWNIIHKVIKDSGIDIRIDMRAKGFTDDMIDAALDSGLDIRLTTKYWGEQMGLPYHPTHITGFNQSKRRHGYADLLRYPKRYEMHYRLWNFGTTRLLLWGDPLYVARFAQSTHLYDGKGFELSEPLAWKMARHRGESYDILKPEYQYYEWEYERYWHMYQLFGRVGYNSNTPAEVWQQEFKNRFGIEAAPFVEKGIHFASQILPRIVAYNLQDISADVSWAEKQRWQDLSVYTNAQPSDIQQFLGIKEAAQYHLEGNESPKIWPQQTSAWFANISNDVLENVKQAEKQMGNQNNKEFVSTMIDLKILAYLAAYHAQRIHAGLNYASYEFTQDLNALDNAINNNKQAVDIWKNIVNLTDGVYHDNLIMGWGGDVDDVSSRPYNMIGNWKDELVKLENELIDLQKMRDEYQFEYQNVIAQFDFGSGNAQTGFLPVSSETRYDRIKGGYGWEHIYSSPSSEYRSFQGEKTTVWDFIHGPEPMTYTYSSFAAEVPNGRYQLKFTLFDNSIEPQDYGPMWIVANGIDNTEKFTIPAGKKVEKTLETTVTDNKAVIVFNSNSDSKWLINSLSINRLEPVITHIPVRKSKTAENITIRATVKGPKSITQVRIRYGNDEQGYKSVPMEHSEKDMYYGMIKGSDVVVGLTYFIEAEDITGNIVTYPQTGGLNPVRVLVTNDTQPPLVTHTPVTNTAVGVPLMLTAKVNDTLGVKWVRLRYRAVNQHQDFRTLPMLPTGEKDVYQAEIPLGHIKPEWDLMYLIEVMDNNGNGAIFPDLEIETPYIVVKLDRGD